METLSISEEIVQNYLHSRLDEVIKDAKKKLERVVKLELLKHKPYYTFAEVVFILDKDRKTVKEYLDNGDLKCKRTLVNKGKAGISKKDLDTFRERNYI